MSFRTAPIPPEGEKIVSAHAMAERERLAISENDASSEEYMQKAAAGIHQIIKNEKNVTLLCAKGNNSGDAYSVGEILLQEGAKVIAYQLFPEKECSELCQKHLQGFRSKGGEIRFLSAINEFRIDPKSVVLDGLLGTGFKGSVEGLMSQVIEAVNRSENPVIAIDISSGVPGDTGIVKGSAIFADRTIYLGLPKIGHFYNNGFEHLGDFVGVDFGMGKKHLDAIEPFGYLVNLEILQHNIPRPKRNANKYTVGQGIALAGSLAMPGAAILATKAALRSGIGIIRLYHPPGMEPQLSTLAPEVIRSSYENKNIERIFTELARTKAVLVGPGLGRTEKIQEMLSLLYAQVKCPLVIDADALYFFEKAPSPAILTPHAGELKHLLNIQSAISDLDLIDKAQAFANEKDVVIVFKGAPTTILAPNQPKVVVPQGNRGMASGGMGDALSGILLALLAQGMDVRDAAILGALIHGLAGNKAKEKFSMHSMTASDLIECLPDIFRSANE